MGAAHQTYQLLIDISQPVTVVIGRLGCFDFPAGQYLYTGSALRNFEARIARHCSGSKKLHWHIDYLLSAPGVRISEVLRHRDAECVVNRRTRGELTVLGFGSSDCRSGCGSHLKRVI